MSIYVPPKADPDLLRSLKDIEEQLDQLKQEPTSTTAIDTTLLSRLEIIESRLNSLAQFEHVAQPFADFKNDGNPSRVLHEDGTWVEPLAGIAKAVTPQLGTSPRRNRPTGLVNMLGSLAVTGALSADTVRSRRLEVMEQADMRLVGVRAYNNANITLNAGVVTLITLNSENWDSHGFHSTTTNTSRLTVPSGLAGYYRITGIVKVSATATSTYRSIRLELNSAGTPTVANILANMIAHKGTANVAQEHECTTTAYLAAGDYVEMYADSGEAATALYGDYYYDSPSLEMFRIGI